jgi:hypothetical protein
MRKKKVNGTGVPVLAASLLVMAGLLAGCGTHVRKAKAEHERMYAELGGLHPEQVLAGRDPVAVLNQALSRAGCRWLEKGLVFASENRRVLVAYAYDPDLKRLVLDEYSEYPWGLGKTHRTSRHIVLPIRGMKVFVGPPDPLSGYQCWDVDLTSLEVDGITIKSRYQLISGDSASDEGGKSLRTRYWHIAFADRETAVDAWAALRVLAR